VLSLSEGLIRGENLAHVTFRGFILEACRGTAVAIKGGADCHVVGCTIRNTGQRGRSACRTASGTRSTAATCTIRARAACR
jgi:hypothetical protein